MRSRLLEFSEQLDRELARHQEAINRALGLTEETGSSPDTQEQEELIEIGDTTEEEFELQTSSSSPEPGSPGVLQEVSFSVEGPELTIDLTDSPPISPPASPVVSQSLGQPGNPASPAMQCPVCLDTFSAIRSRGEHLLVWLVYLSSPSRLAAGQHSVWPRLLQELSPPVCPHPGTVSHLQEEDRYQGLSPSLPLKIQKSKLLQCI